MEPMAMGGEEFPLMVLRGGIDYNEYLAGWCERMIEQLRAPAREASA